MTVAVRQVDRADWPEAVSDGVTLACADCGEVPMFDYHVSEGFWRRWVPDDARLGIVCLPCLNGRCAGQGLAEALERIQWTGTGHTVVLHPTARYEYVPAVESITGRQWMTEQDR
jgi:hypothetical protein